MQIPDSGAPMSLRAYAKRRGVSPMAVSRAVASGRLKASIVHDEQGAPKIRDPDLADREWAENTSHEHRERAMGRATTVQHAGGVELPPDRSPPVHFPDDGPPPLREGMTHNDAKTAESYWKAKMAELKFRQEAGELVEAAGVEHRLTDVFQTCRTKLLGIPSRAKQALPHLSIVDLGTLEGLIREALEDLAGPATEVEP